MAEIILRMVGALIEALIDGYLKARPERSCPIGLFVEVLIEWSAPSH
jgi:hypothetical protein